MAVTFGNEGTGSTNAGTSFTIPITIGSGANRAVFVTVSTLASAATVSLSGAGVSSYVQVDGYVLIPAPGAQMSLWYGLNPTAGAQTITVTLAVSTEAAGVATEASGVNQSTPIGTAATATGTTTAVSANATGVVSGDGAIGGVGIRDSVGGTRLNANGNNVVSPISADLDTTSWMLHNIIDTGTVVVAGTLNNAVSWGEVAVRVIASVAAGSVVTPRSLALLGVGS